MLKNFFRVGIRNLLKQPGFSFINISGLAIGMASAILILLWIANEVSYDRFHTKGDRLYEVWSIDREKVDGILRAYTPTPEIMAPSLKKDYPELEEVTRVGWPENILFTRGEKILKARGITVDTGFITMFSFPLVQGNPASALRDPYSIILTEKLAAKLFGKENPMGKTVKLDNNDNFTVTGILKDLPNNTQFDFEWLTSYQLRTMKNWVDKDWTDFSIRTFTLLKPNTSFDHTNKKIRDIIYNYSNHNAKTDIFLYPVSKLRLYSTFVDGKPSGGRIDSIKILSVIAGFLLLIACINFMNLSTARSEKRAKEVGIRKVSGALRQSLIWQFLGESILISAISGILALFIVQISLPAFNELTSKSLSINYASAVFWLVAIGFVILTGILAGSYPAFFLSAFRPVAVLKGTFRKVNALLTPRKVLVVVQFSFAIMLTIATILVKQQIDYGTRRQTGYDRSNLIYLPIEGDAFKNYELIKNDLLNSGAAVAVSQSHAPLTQVWSSGHGLTWKGKDPTAEITFNRSSTNGGLVKTAGFKLVEGRDIDLVNFPSDSSACLINETAAKILGFKDPIGQTITDDPNTWHIVGVIKDFILESPFEPIKPIIFKGSRSWRNIINVKLSNNGTVAKNLATTQAIFKKYNPAYPFEYTFMDEDYARKFTDENLTRKLAGLFAGLTIFISCLGLFGLATYMAEARIKEIGVRKVLGASVGNITLLLSKDFMKLVMIAILIASPFAYWAMSQWLKGYNYRISIGASVFIYAGIIAMGIALVSVSYQAIKASVANPVKSLRSE
jgi:ABC-type antimicrobial peptide transport system permease subunit